jgi:hypothetical protein
MKGLRQNPARPDGARIYLERINKNPDLSIIAHTGRIRYLPNNLFLMTAKYPTGDQGDQIGRIFATWVTVYLFWVVL